MLVGLLFFFLHCSFYFFFFSSSVMSWSKMWTLQTQQGEPSPCSIIAVAHLSKAKDFPSLGRDNRKSSSKILPYFILIIFYVCNTK